MIVLHEINVDAMGLQRGTVPDLAEKPAFVTKPPRLQDQNPRQACLFDVQASLQSEHAHRTSAAFLRCHPRIAPGTGLW